MKEADVVEYAEFLTRQAAREGRHVRLVPEQPDEPESETVRPQVYDWAVPEDENLLASGAFWGCVLLATVFWGVVIWAFGRWIL